MLKLTLTLALTLTPTPTLTPTVTPTVTPTLTPTPPTPTLTLTLTHAQVRHMLKLVARHFRHAANSWAGVKAVALMQPLPRLMPSSAPGVRRQPVSNGAEPL